MIKIPVFTLTRQNKLFRQKYIDAVKAVIDKGIFILGDNVSQFEKDFAAYLGVKYATGVASGTDALSLSLRALGVSVGDEVIMPANSYPTVFAITQIGAIPRLVDIEASTFNIDPIKIEAALTPKTKALIAVHLYGHTANLTRIIPITRKHKIPMIEDCAQAHGAEIKTGQRWTNVGTFGDSGCFSFYPTKNLGAFGDGGMVTTNNPDINEKIRLLRMYGEKKRYMSVAPGTNSRLDELQAAILLVKLRYLNDWNNRRRMIAEIYKTGINKKTEIILPSEAGYAKHAYHLFVIRSKKRDQLKKYLETKGIGTAIHFPKPIHLQPSYAYLGYKKGDFPESEKASNEVLSLPMYPELTDKEAEYVSDCINRM